MKGMEREKRRRERKKGRGGREKRRPGRKYFQSEAETLGTIRPNTARADFSRPPPA